MSKDPRQLLARLAAERGGLLNQLLGLDRQALTEERFVDGWTVKDCLVHIAAWDRWEQRQMKRATGGKPPEDVAVDAFNAAVVAKGREWSLDEVVEEVVDARAAWVGWLGTLADEELLQRRPIDGRDWAFAEWLEVQWKHDAGHAAEIAAWRRAYGWKGDVGPRCVLRAALHAAREELLAAADLVRPDKREARLVCGEWTLKDVLGHLADWERVSLIGLRAMACGETPQVGAIEDIEAWNQAHAEARRHQTWNDVLRDLHAVREGLLRVLEDVAEEDMAQSHPFPWGPEGTAYQWASVSATHDREHAEGIRETASPRTA